MDFITGAVLLGVAAGIIGVAWGWFDSTSPEAAMKPVVFYGIGLALMAFIGLFILRCGMSQICGYDQSILVDFGWRMFKRQRAYIDFPCTVPVAFVLGPKFAFQWFGAYWKSIIDITALFAMGTFAWSLFLLAQLFGLGWATLLWAMTVQAISSMLASFWWYSPITDVTGALYALAAIYWLRCPAKKKAIISYGAALLLMATMKPNVAGVLIVGFSVILFVSPNHRWKALWVSLGSFALFVILLWLNQMSLFGMITAYRSISSRGASLVPFLIDLNPLQQRLAMLAVASILLPVVIALSQGRQGLRSVGAWLPAIVMVGGICFYICNIDPVNHPEETRWRKVVGGASLVLPVFMALYAGRRSLRSASVWIGYVGMLGGLYGFLTNSEQKLIDLPPVLMGGLLLVAALRHPVSSNGGSVFQMPIRWNRYFCLVCVVLGAGGLAQGYARDRVYSAGPGQFFQYDGSTHTIASGFFKGVHCGDIFDEVLKEEAEVLRQAQSATVWFGPRMEWGYAAFDKESPLNEPVVWDRLTMFDSSKEQFYLDQFLQSRRQVLILFKNDFCNYTQDEVQQFLQYYDVNQSFPLLTILILKK
ncbi:MAG: hypothetical protein ABSA83_13460 [Verrucomicrobiota bacterium]|jgi:hypothetical protein